MLHTLRLKEGRKQEEMDRASMKPAGFLVLFMVASLLASSMMGVGANQKQVVMTGQLCKSHDDCKANSANFCISKMSGGFGHCAGFGSTLGVATKAEDGQKKKKKKPKRGGCGKCETDDDCRGCPAAASCEKIVLNGYCA